MAALVAAVALSFTASAQSGLGSFEGEVVAQFMRDGRNMQLNKPFAYVDPSGRRWDVPAGMITDGASIPRALWLCCPPFTGKYRLAAVVHDHYCQTKSRTWQDTHMVFYSAMRAAGVAEKQAKLMFSAVYEFGPRWGSGDRKIRPMVSTTEQQKTIDQLKAWIEQDNPSIDEITRRIDSQ
jgi:hypothetical protein